MNPRSREIVLFAITRLDISNNSLTQVPAIIFQLQSLRYLNLAQNKIEKLPDPKDSHQVTSPTSEKMSKLYKSIYTANVLEELYLQVGYEKNMYLSIYEFIKNFTTNRIIVLIKFLKNYSDYPH